MWGAVPMLQSTEHVFDFVASLVQAHMVGLLDFAVAQRRYAGAPLLALSQALPKPMGIIPFVCQQR
jgi:hypothetical protein